MRKIAASEGGLPSNVRRKTSLGDDPKVLCMPSRNFLFLKITGVSATLTVGSTGNAISGKKFNGFSQGATYGDDAQMSSNYPIVRITNNNTGDVCFGRSYNFSKMGVWTTGKMDAVFDIPASCETGASALQVVVNGVASAGVAVTLS